ncbi:MAG TPA: efflux RND transporter periplasmic adaptor subunit [Gammaproteobacteria bacterium]|nr:efflux RND transporter periplasmic adaptor subunit [Gammaproteobacteria bacterium]
MKNALLIVLAFALGGGAMWYVTKERGTSAATGPAAAAGGRPGGGPPGGGGFGGFGGGRPQAQLPLVTVGHAKRDQIYDVVEALGTAQANESVTLTAKVTDSVRRVNFEDGDYVEAGTVLIELTNQEEEALLAEARANLDDSQSQLRRLEDLSARGLTSASELDVARSRAGAQQARFNSIVARLRDRLILAPFSGLLGFRQVSPGTMLSPNTAITSIDDISTIKLDFTVPESAIGTMTPGAKVIAKSVSFPDRDFQGTVRTVGSRVDPVTRAITVRAHVENKDRALRPGMLLTVAVVTAERTALVVPEGSVFQVQNRAYVYRVDGDTVHQQQIEVGGRRFGVVEVLSGLQEGDPIVVEGIIKLREGARVRYEEAAVSESSQGSAQSRRGDARS